MLHIDADILVYRVGFASEKETEGIAISRMHESIRTMCEKTQSENYIPFLTSTDKSNFRYTIFPEYKANRTQPKPRHYDTLREFLIERHGAVVVYGEEADDRLGILQTEETTIGSIDKDLDQVPGKHYNFVQDRHYFITPEQGLFKLYEQILTGDRIDNIPGIHGIGPKRAYKLLEKCSGGVDMYRACVEAYRAVNRTEEEVIRNGKLLKIRQKEGEIWEPPVE